jgi:hypothetical protein
MKNVIEFKYPIGAKVVFFNDNRINEAHVTAVRVTINDKGNQHELYEVGAKKMIFHREELFSTKEELLGSLFTSEI